MSGRSLSASWGGILPLSGMALLALSALSPAAAPPARVAEVDPEPAGGIPRTNEEDRTRSVRNLQKIGLGLQRFHEEYAGLPAAAIVDRKGNALLSWRVAILPFIGENDLYEQFRLDEPWDSKHNKTLLAKMPKVYAPTIRGNPRKPNETYYQVLTGPDTLFDPALTRRFPAVTLGYRMLFVSDGPNETAMVVEAEKTVPWTKPEDVAYDAKKPLPKLGGLFREGFHVVIATGDVRFVGRQAKPAALRSLITPSGEERFSWDDLPAPKK